jgi:hypothetical protein
VEEEVEEVEEEDGDTAITASRTGMPEIRAVSPIPSSGRVIGVVTFFDDGDSL